MKMELLHIAFNHGIKTELGKQSSFWKTLHKIFYHGLDIFGNIRKVKNY